MLARSAICAALHRTVPVGSSSRSAAASRSRTSRPLTPPAAELCAKSPWTAPGEAVLWSLRGFWGQKCTGVDPHPGGQRETPPPRGATTQPQRQQEVQARLKMGEPKTASRTLTTSTSTRSDSWRAELLWRGDSRFATERINTKLC